MTRNNEYTTDRPFHIKGSGQPIRRRLRPTGELSAAIYSLSREGKEVSHDVQIHADGRVTCSCEHFRYRLAKHRPTVHTPSKWCKHVLRHAENLVRKGVAA